MGSASVCGPAPDGRSSPVAGPRAARACRPDTHHEQGRRRSDPGRGPGNPRKAGGSVCRARVGVGRIRGRPSCRRRGHPQPGPADPPGRVAGALAPGPRRRGRRARCSIGHPRGAVVRTGSGGGRTALARTGGPLLSGLRALVWLLGAPVRLVLLGAIRLYQLTLAGWLGGQCRFHPTCSRYAQDAIRTHGAARGTLMAAWRIARCGPFTRGGVDHVPPRTRVRSYDTVIPSEAGR